MALFFNMPVTKVNNIPRYNILRYDVAGLYLHCLTYWKTFTLLIEAEKRWTFKFFHDYSRSNVKNYAVISHAMRSPCNQSVRVCVPVHVCMSACMYVCVSVCLCVCMCVCVCVCVFKLIHICYSVALRKST